MIDSDEPFEDLTYDQAPEQGRWIRFDVEYPPGDDLQCYRDPKKAMKEIIRLIKLMPDTIVTLKAWQMEYDFKMGAEIPNYCIKDEEFQGFEGEVRLMLYLNMIPDNELIKYVTAGGRAGEIIAARLKGD